ELKEFQFKQIINDYISKRVIGLVICPYCLKIAGAMTIMKLTGQKCNMFCRCGAKFYPSPFPDKKYYARSPKAITPDDSK
ncbi:MAG: hypothetical protein WC389_13185, partial [Lutibacter sp.]